MIYDHNRANLKDWILDEADGETILGVVIAGGDEEPQRNAVLSWSAALPHLDRDFDAGHTGPNCPAVTAWTASWVIGVLQYDGSVEPFRVSRNPIDHIPEMPGG